MKKDKPGPPKPAWKEERETLQRELRLVEVAVARAGGEDVRDLALLSRQDLLALPGVGERALRAVRHALAERGLRLVGDRKPREELFRRTPKLELSEPFKHALVQAQHEVAREGTCLYCGKQGGKPYALPSGPVRVHDECVKAARRAGAAVAQGKVTNPEGLAALGLVVEGFAEEDVQRSGVQIPPWAIRQGRA